MSSSKFTDETELKTRYQKEEHNERNERDHDKQTEERHGSEPNETGKEIVQPTQTKNTQFAINSVIKVELDKGDEENTKQNNYIPPNIGNNNEKVNETEERKKEKRKEQKEGKRRNEKKKGRIGKKKKEPKYLPDSSDSSSSSNSSSSPSSSDDENPTRIFTAQYTSEAAYQKEEECRRVLGMTGGAGQFTYLQEHPNFQSVFESRLLCKSSKGVGKIQFANGHCTCFRVGSKYIMTTLHAVRAILNTYNAFSMPINGNSDLDSHPNCDLSVLSNADVKIDFNFEVENQPSLDIHIFTFKRIKTMEEIPFLDEATDVIVLELDIKPGQVVPPNFTYLGIPKFDKSFTLIAHSGGEPKAFDKVSKIVDISDPRTLEDIEYLRQQSREYVSRNDKDPSVHTCEAPPFNTLDNKDRLLFHCASGKGAAGSPGVQVTSEGKVVVVTMLLHGYPDWYHDYKCETLKSGWQKAFTVEQGVNFASVYTIMKDRNKPLCDEIFI